MPRGRAYAFAYEYATRVCVCIYDICREGSPAHLRANVRMCKCTCTIRARTTYACAGACAWHACMRPKVAASHAGPLTTHCLLPTAHCPLPTSYCPLPTAHCPLPTKARPSMRDSCRSARARRAARTVVARGPCSTISDALAACTCGCSLDAWGCSLSAYG